ncbi:hypothetical protein [Streptomyces sp. URMC 123]|uniref:hypothetical protein n=1 Tax=Streptomyces sp. URMC 123 TaxID=3423403 RepID=UPI003F534FE7
MWGSAAACLLLACVAPLFGDDPKGVTMPLVNGVLIANVALYLRRKGAAPRKGQAPSG